MALNDIKISELPELTLENVTDDTIFSAVEGDINYKIKMSTISALGLEALYTTRPLGEMSQATPGTSQTFAGATFETITAFDKIQFERGLNIDLPTSSIIIEEDGNYQVSMTINSEYASNQAVDFALLINGVVNEALGTLQGAGAGKPVYIGGGDIDPLVAGDIITLGARESTEGTVDVIFQKVRLVVGRV